MGYSSSNIYSETAFNEEMFFFDKYIYRQLTNGNRFRLSDMKKELTLGIAGVCVSYT